MPDMPDKDIGISFLKAICPICNQEYIYVKAFKPVTCGKKCCVLLADELGLIAGVRVSV